MKRLIITVFFVALFSSCGPKNMNKYQFKTESKDEVVSSNTPGTHSEHSQYDHTDILSNVKIPKGVKKSNYPIILHGQKDIAIIFLHGFIASPFEPLALSKILNQEGYTVYIPLIEGFGGSTELANTSNYQNWKLTVKKSIDLLSPDFKKFVIIGFSLGGTIISDFILNQSVQENHQIESIVLLAPFYKPKLWGGNAANSLVNVFTDSVSLETLYKGSRNPDLLIPLSNPDYYNNAMPLNAVNQLYDFSDEITSMENSVISKVPVFLVMTEDDETVDNEYSRQFVTKHFPDNEIFEFRKKDKVRHQFIVPEGNHHLGTLADKISLFIKQKQRKDIFGNP